MYQKAWKKYQYSISRSVEILLSSNARHHPSCRAHDLANCQALSKIAKGRLNKALKGSKKPQQKPVALSCIKNREFT
jgi:hypothetical protein